jgi:hypothetical protein
MVVFGSDLIDTRPHLTALVELKKYLVNQTPGRLAGKAAIPVKSAKRRFS